MELVTAGKTIIHGGRIRQKGETFEVKDRMDSKGVVVENSAAAEAARLVDEGYAEKATETDKKRFHSLNGKREKPQDKPKELANETDEQESDRKTRELGGVPPKRDEGKPVSIHSPEPPPPNPLADDEEEVEEKNDATGEVKKIRRKKGGR